MIATGAALKQEKCYAYFMVYQFIHGRSSMGSIRALSEPSPFIPQLEGPILPSHLMVPLSNGTSAPIPALPPASISLVLGIWFGPSSCGTKHILEMYRKGHIWADKLHAGPLTHSEVLTSFSLQLYPGMAWGFTTVVLSLHKLYEAPCPVYFKILPLLGMQRQKELPWRTLPEAFQ
jgi:hypothetical protein